MPEELCKGEKLEELVLRRANRVSGTLPTECLSHDTITKIDLKRTKVGGTIPSLDKAEKMYAATLQWRDEQEIDAMRDLSGEQALGCDVAKLVPHLLRGRQRRPRRQH